MRKIKTNIISKFQVISVTNKDFIKEKVCCRTFVTPYSRVKKIIDIVKVEGRKQFFSIFSVRYNKLTFPNQISSKLD